MQDPCTSGTVEIGSGKVTFHGRILVHQRRPSVASCFRPMRLNRVDTAAMTPQLFSPSSATLRVLFIHARARLMASCEEPTLTDERLVYFTEEMNKIADAIREAAIHKKRAPRGGCTFEAPALMSPLNAVVLAQSAELRHAINAAPAPPRSSGPA